MVLWALPGMAAPPTSIVLDGSLGHAAGAVNPTSPGFYEITPSMGKSVGANLFQSFGTFNLGTGNTADFEANAGTQNIIARVTGGSASSIDGTITSTVGPGGPSSGANLFLLNPAGVMFGPNASINLTGALTVSTASYAKLSDGTVFYADVNHPINDAGLTSAPISAFGFLTATPAPVTFTGSAIANPGGIHVIAGDITLNEAILYAPGGNLTMFSAASAGEVPFSLAAPGAGFASATNTAFGAITMQNVSFAAINSATGGGSIVIRGGHLLVENDSRISSTNSGGAAGGGISIQAVTLAFQTGGNIFSSTAGAGAGGDIAVQSGSISAAGTDVSGNRSGIFAQSLAGGNAGAVTLTATGAIALTGGAQILTTATASGGGDMVLKSGSLSVDGASPYGFDSLISSFAGPTGVAGAVRVTTGALTLTNGGQVDTQTDNSGGDLFVTASSLTADGVAPVGNGTSGLNVFANGAGTSGAMQIVVGGAMQLTNGATINSQAETGSEGTIAITAGSLAVSGSGALGNDSGIYSATEGSANAGTVHVTVAGSATFSGGGNINTASFGSGNAGDVVLQAGSLSIDGSDVVGNDSGIYSGADGAVGNGGMVSIAVTGAMSVTNGGVVSVSSAGAGDAGDVTVNCGSLAIGGYDLHGYTSAIASLAVATGNGGDVTVSVAGAARLTAGGDISADASGSGHGGDVRVTAGSLVVDGSTPVSNLTDTEISSNNVGSGAGGVVEVTVRGAMRVADGGQVSANTRGLGNAGSVTVRAGSLAVSGRDGAGHPSTVSSSAVEEGDGGTVAITAPGGVVVSNFGEITAFSSHANAGDIRVLAGNLMLSGEGEIGTVAANNGGNITLKIAGIVYLLNSAISATAGDVGGNITIDPEFVVLDNSTITAYGGVADGNISIETSYFLDQNSPISATGFITVSVPNLDLSGDLLPLPEVLVDDEKRLRETCARSVNHEFSTLTVVGRGGTELAPDELQPDFGVEQ